VGRREEEMRGMGWKERRWYGSGRAIEWEEREGKEFEEGDLEGEGYIVWGEGRVLWISESG